MSEKLSLTILDRNNPYHKTTYYFDSETDRQMFIKALEITLKRKLIHLTTISMLKLRIDTKTP